MMDASELLIDSWRRKAEGGDELPVRCIACGSEVTTADVLAALPFRWHVRRVGPGTSRRRNDHG